MPKVDTSRIDPRPLLQALADMDRSSRRMLRLTLKEKGRAGSTGFAGRRLWKALIPATRGNESALLAYLATGSPDQLQRVARSASFARAHASAERRQDSAAVWNGLLSIAAAMRDEMLADRDHAGSTESDSEWSAIVEGFGAAPVLSTCEPDDTIDPPMSKEEWDALMDQLAAVVAARPSR